MAICGYCGRFIWWNCKDCDEKKERGEARCEDEAGFMRSERRGRPRYRDEDGFDEGVSDDGPMGEDDYKMFGGDHKKNDDWDN